MSQETHFNDKVSPELQAKLKSLAEAVKDDFISDLNTRAEGYGCRNIDEIYGYHISGFIPNQLGGYEVTELYRSDVDSTYHFTNAQTDAMIAREKDCYNSYRLDSPELNLAEDWSYDDLPEANQNEFSDYENEWFEPALLRANMWVDKLEGPSYGLGNNDVEPEAVYIALSLAYSDAPYYRRNSDDETLTQFSIPVAEFMTTDNTIIIKRLHDAVESAT